MWLIHWFRGLVYVEWVSLDTHSASIQRPFQLNATITPSNATNQNIVWTSSNTNIATIDSDWLVTPTWEWNVTITVTLDGHSDSCTLEVSPIPVTGVSLNKNNVTVNMWSSEQLIALITPSDATNQNVTWSSSNTSVATVSNTWLVTYVADGNCTITVTTEDWWYTATCSATCVSKRKVCFLLVWWWWGGSQYYWWGWGAGWVIQCANYEMNAWNYSIVIWTWGSWIWTWCDWNNWWNSTFNWLIAYWWWWGWWYPSRAWHNWWSWWGSWYYNWTPWYWCSWQWYWWWANSWYWSGWWWWAWAAWQNWQHNCLWWYWWCWIQSNIDWANKWYASWWTWHNWYWRTDYETVQTWCPALSWARAESNATTYWWWGWWVPNNATYWKWKVGIFILAYPSSCWYNISWWTKYLCNWNCIHCFTWNGTLTIS